MSKRFIDVDDFETNAYFADTSIDIAEYIAVHGCADVVEVVRCKDCKFHFKMTENEYLCTKGFPFYTTHNDFCSHAKRGEGK